MSTTLSHLNNVTEEKQELQTEMIRAKEREGRYRIEISEASELHRRSEVELATANLRQTDHMKAAKSMKAVTKEMLVEEAESRAFRNELDESRKELAEMARGSSVRDADYNTMKANVESLRVIARQSPKRT